jgi:hypothetical protein
MNAPFFRLKANSFVRALLFSYFIFQSSYLFTGCSKLNEVSVSARNFEDEIQLAQNLVFTFNKDLVSDSDLETWQAVEYLRIEPKVEGVFKWSAKNELVFSPSNGFKDATNYKAVLTKSLLSKSATKNYGLDNESFKFHTPYLKAQKIETYWMKGADNKPVAKVKVDFNYPVQETDVKNLLKVQLEDADTKFNLNSTPNDQKLVLSLDNVPSLKDESSLKTIIEKGVKIVGSAGSTQEKLEIEGVLPSPYNVKVVDIETGFEKNQGFVKVITTQQISSDNLKDTFIIEPAVETQTELTPFYNEGVST